MYLIVSITETGFGTTNESKYQVLYKARKTLSTIYKGSCHDIFTLHKKK